MFDGEGRVASMDVGSPGDVATRCARCSTAGQALERVLPAFTANPARLLRLPRKGHLAPWVPMPIWWCSTTAGPWPT